MLKYAKEPSRPRLDLTRLAKYLASQRNDYRVVENMGRVTDEDVRIARALRDARRGIVPTGGYIAPKSAYEEVYNNFKASQNADEPMPEASTALKILNGRSIIPGRVSVLNPGIRNLNRMIIDSKKEQLSEQERAEEQARADKRARLAALRRDAASYVKVARKYNKFYNNFKASQDANEQAKIDALIPRKSTALNILNGDPVNDGVSVLNSDKHNINKIVSDGAIELSNKKVAELQDQNDFLKSLGWTGGGAVLGGALGAGLAGEGNRLLGGTVGALGGGLLANLGHRWAKSNNYV